MNWFVKQLPRWLLPVFCLLVTEVSNTKKFPSQFIVISIISSTNHVSIRKKANLSRGSNQCEWSHWPCPIAHETKVHLTSSIQTTLSLHLSDFKYFIYHFLFGRYVIPLDVQVAHYTPAIFPLVPMISPKINKLCENSWKKIVANKEMTETGRTSERLLSILL